MTGGVSVDVEGEDGSEWERACLLLVRGNSSDMEELEDAVDGVNGRSNESEEESLPRGLSTKNESTYSKDHSQQKVRHAKRHRHTGIVRISIDKARCSTKKFSQLFRRPQELRSLTWIKAIGRGRRGRVNDFQSHDENRTRKK